MARSTLLLLLAAASTALLRPALAQTTVSGSFLPTVPATPAPTASATAGVTADTTSNTTTGIVCPARYHDCAVINRPEACCGLDQVCVFDDQDRLACCPFRTQCVGQLDTSSSSRPLAALGDVVPAFAAGVAAVGAVWWVRGYLG